MTGKMKTLSDKPIVLLSKVAEVLFKHLFLVFMNIKSLCDFFFPQDAMILKRYGTQKTAFPSCSNSLPLLSFP